MKNNFSIILALGILSETILCDNEHNKPTQKKNNLYYFKT